MTRRHAEIAGAGFAGITLAAALAQRGWSVRVHERAPECRQFGAGIWFWENGMRVLNALGAIEDALSDALMIPNWQSLDAHGKVIDFFAFGNHETGGRTYCLLRQRLYEAIYAAAMRYGVEVVTSSKAVGATPEGELLLEGGERLRADLVVGADGVNSKVRDSLGLLRHRRVHGDGAIRVIVPRLEEEAESPEWNRIYEWWNGPRRLLYTPCSTKDVYLCLTSVASDHEALSSPIPKAVWIRSFPKLERFLARMPSEGRWDRFESIYVNGWSRGRAAILGDAAHAMVPGLGQGCGSAVHNAYALAVTLDEEPTIERALAAWEKRARPLIAHTQFWSWTTWPLTRVPAPLARAVFHFPGLRSWIYRQRAKPSLHIPYGTENQQRWIPKADNIHRMAKTG